MPTIHLRPDAANELASLVASTDPPRTAGDVVLACVRVAATRSHSLAAQLARIEPLQPPRGTGRRFHPKGTRKPPTCSVCLVPGHKATALACPSHPRHGA